MLDLARPWVLLLLGPLLALAWWRLRNPGPSIPQAIPESFQASRRKGVVAGLPWVFRILGLSILLLGLSGPRLSIPGPPAEGVTVVLVLDLSGSMETRDMDGRSRLDVAKEELHRFVRARPGDLIGLVTFAREAETRAPPTTDHVYLLQTLEELEVDAEADGTAIGTGLGLAAHRSLQSATPSRALILMTDGRNNTGSADPGAVARASRSLGVRIHTIGVGGATGAEPLDREILRSVAEETGGRSFLARDRQAFREILLEVGAMEKGPVPAEITPLHRPLHPGLIWAGVVFLILEGLFWMAPGGRIR